MVTRMDSQTWPERNARSSRRSPPGALSPWPAFGTRARMPASASTPMPVMAQHVGGGQAGEHDGDSSGLLGGRHHAGGHHSADAEEGAVSQGGHDAADHHGPVVGGRGRDEVAGDEQYEQDGEHGFPLEA